MIGDTAEDSEAAEANCVDFIYASYGYGSVPSSQQTIDTFSMLPTLLAADRLSTKKVPT